MVTSSEQLRKHEPFSSLNEVFFNQLADEAVEANFSQGGV